MIINMSLSLEKPIEVTKDQKKKKVKHWFAHNNNRTKMIYSYCVFVFVLAKITKAYTGSTLRPSARSKSYFGRFHH